MAGKVIDISRRIRPPCVISGKVFRVEPTREFLERLEHLLFRLDKEKEGTGELVFVDFSGSTELCESGPDEGTVEEFQQ